MSSFPPFPEIAQNPHSSCLSPDELCHRINTHRNTIQQLEEQIKCLRKAIAQDQGYLNRVQPRINVSMPPEILEEVFKQLMRNYLPQRVIRWSCPSLVDSSPTRCTWLKVALVCRYWRSLVVSFSELFSFVDIGSTYESTTPSIPRWLELSDPAPLYLSFRCFNETTVDLIRPYVSRITGMRIVDHEARSFETLPVFPAVQSLTYLKQPYHGVTADESQKLLAHFPTLQHLHFCYEGEMSTLPWTLPLPSLTYLSLSYTSISDHMFVTMLQLLPSLQTLELQLETETDESQEPSNFTIADRVLPCLKLFSGSTRAYKRVLELLGPAPEVLRFGISSNKLWMLDMIKARHPDIVELVSDRGHPFMELRVRSKEPSTTQVSEIHPIDDHSHDQDIDFDVDEVNLLNISSLVYTRVGEVQVLSNTLSRLKVRTLRWSIPTKGWPDFSPLSSGYDCLENLHIQSTHSPLVLLEVAESIVRERGYGQPKLKLLSLEIPVPTSGRQRDPSTEREKEDMIAYLRDSVEELRLPSVGIF